MDGIQSSNGAGSVLRSGPVLALIGARSNRFDRFIRLLQAEVLFESRVAGGELAQPEKHRFLCLAAVHGALGLQSINESINRLAARLDESQPAGIVLAYEWWRQAALLHFSTS